MISDVISRDKSKAFLFCNEAIVRAALESDVKVVAFYPGSPVSEILDTFFQISNEFNIMSFSSAPCLIRNLIKLIGLGVSNLSFTLKISVSVLEASAVFPTS